MGVPTRRGYTAGHEREEPFTQRGFNQELRQPLVLCCVLHIERSLAGIETEVVPHLAQIFGELTMPHTAAILKVEQKAVQKPPHGLDTDLAQSADFILQTSKYGHGGSLRISAVGPAQ